MPNSKLKTLFVIIDRNLGDKAADSLAKWGVQFQHNVLSMGTARTGLLEVFGMGETEKTLIIGTVLEDKLDMVKQGLEREFAFDAPGHGIAFTVPVSAVGGPATYRILSGENVPQKRGKKK